MEAPKQSPNAEREYEILSGDVDDSMTAKLLDFLISAKGDELTIYLNTYGGDVVQALEIYEMLISSPRQITVHAFGACMSVGTLIICGGDRRLSTPNCQFMIHYGEETNTNSAEARYNRTHERTMRKIYKDTLNVSASTIGKWMKSDRYFKPEEALKYGLVQEQREIRHG